MVLSGCRIVSEIGRGGMGIVYRAVDEKLQRRVAVKFLHRHLADPEARTRFVREAAAMAQLDHPGIARIFTCAEHLDQPYYVMEFLEGEDLDTCLRRAAARRESPGTFPPEVTPDGAAPDTASFLRAGLPAPLESAAYSYHVNTAIATIADALHHAHAHGIVHRDVKPSNVQVCASGALKLLDFGLAATVLPGGHTAGQAIHGTVAYMAPERFQEDHPRADCRMDVYALGVVYYQLLTLRHPVTASSLSGAIGQIVQGRFEDPRSLNPAIPEATAAILARCLAVAPSDRFESAEALADAVRARTVVPRVDRQTSAPSDLSTLTVELRPAAVPGEAPVAAPAAGPAAAPTPAPAVEPAALRPAVPPAIAAVVADLRECAERDLSTNLDFDLALDRLQQAVELDPDDVDVRLLLCRALSAVGDRSGCEREAAALGARRTALDERQRLLLDLLVASFVDRDRRKAQVSAAKLLAMDHFDEFAFRVACSALIQRGRLQDAREQAAAVVRDHPHIASGWLYLTMVSSLLGDRDGACDTIGKFVAAHPDLPVGHLMMSNHLVEAGDLARARVHVDRALELDPTDRPALAVLGQLHMVAGDFPAAIRAIRMSIGMSQHDLHRAEGYLALCRIHEELGEAQKASECLAIARAQAPERPYLGREEHQELLAGIDLRPMFAEAVLPEDREIVDEEIKEACLEAIRLGGLWGYPRVDYYAVDDSGSTRHVLVAAGFNEYPVPAKETRFLLDVVPVLPFVDGQGRILTVKYERLEGLAGSFFACISYGEEHAPGTYRFLLAGLPCDALAESAAGGWQLRTRGYRNRSRKAYRLLVSLPGNLRATAWSEAPACSCESAGRTTWIFRRHLGGAQDYPAIRVDLEGTDPAGRAAEGVSAPGSE